MTYKRYIGLASIVVGLLVVGLAGPAAAHMEGEHAEGGTHTTTVREAAKARVQGKLDDAKKKVCATRAEAIQKTMSRAAEAGQKHLTLFNGVQTRVEEFYTKKQLNVTTYESLKAAAKAKYDAAAAAVKAVKDSAAFDCNADNPVGTADAFKTKVKDIHAALKDYRSAVNALLVAVKTAARSTEGVQ